MPNTAKLCSGYGQWHTDNPDSPSPKPYQDITLDDVLGMVATPPGVAKENAQWFIPSTLLSREAEKQRAAGSYHAVWCDFDNHTLLTDIQAILAGLLCFHIIYSSRSSTLDRQKWRVIIPLAIPANAGDWQRVAAIINDRFEQAGIVSDRASERVNQICYLPNRGVFYQYHIETGVKPLNWPEALADELAEKRQQANQEKLRLDQLKEQSRLKAIERMATGSHSPIEAYNHSYPVMQCLELYRYKRVGKKYLSPNSTSGNAGVTIQGQRWTSSHGSDAGIGQPNKSGSGCNGDAFDLFTWYEHGGNRNAALKAAGDMFTINGKTLNKTNQQEFTATQSENRHNALAEKTGATPSVANLSIELSLDDCPDFPRIGLKTSPDARGEKTPPQIKVASLIELLSHEFPKREMVLEPVFTLGSLNMIFSRRGIGKTHAALGIAYAASSGSHFWSWRANRPFKTIYIDGEMPGEALQSRLAEIVRSSKKAPPDGYFNTITIDMNEGRMPDLATLGGQIAIESHWQNAELIIVDNLSCLCRSGKENEAASWQSIGEWAMRMRSLGKCVIFVHHAGKNGEQRGTSKREDLLDVVIELKRPGDYQATDGARFIVDYIDHAID